MPRLLPRTPSQPAAQHAEGQFAAETALPCTGYATFCCIRPATFCKSEIRNVIPERLQPKTESVVLTIKKTNDMKRIIYNAAVIVVLTASFVAFTMIMIAVAVIANA